MYACTCMPDVRLHPDAYETHCVLLSDGFAQISRLLQREYLDALSLDPMICVWTSYTDFKGYLVQQKHLARD